MRRGERVDVIKIDVEGAELAVLEGMTCVIAENPELSIIAEFGPSHLRMADVEPEEWLSAFQNRGFDPFVIDELSGECRVADVSKLKEVEIVNILFCHGGSSARARVLTKIAWVTPFAARSAIGRVSASVIEALCDRNHEVTIIAANVRSSRRLFRGQLLCQ